MKRLAILASHPIQYQVPLYRRLHALEEIDLTVLYCSEMGRRQFRDWEMGVEVSWDLDLESGYRHEFLRNLGLGKTWLRHINPSLPFRLWKGKYDAVIFQTGWGSFSAFIGFAACRVLGIPIVLFGDSAFLPAHTSLRERLRSATLRALFSRVGAFLVTGTMNREFYRQYGASPERFHFTPFAVDNERFQAEVRKIRPDRESIRADLGIDPDDVAVLFTGKMSRRKNPRQLLEAFSQVQANRRAWLLFAGDGEERQPLERIATEQRLDRVKFLGFVNQTELPRYYGIADVFVLPSRFDPRGLVVNEAMNAGLPCIVSDRVGASADLVVDGVTGRVYPQDRTDLLKEALEDLIKNEDRRKSMSVEARDRIDSWSYDEEIAGIRSAVDAVTMEHPE